MLKRAIRRTLGLFGFELRRLDRRATHVGVLENATRNGLAPSTVIDIGAAYGSFSTLCSAILPNARFLLIEPLEEYGPWLTPAAAALDASVVHAAAGAAPGHRTINVHPDLVGSSFFSEEEESDVNGIPRSVSVITVDQAVSERQFKGPFLIKVDVQGAELDVLDGAVETLEDCQMVILEVSFFRFFTEGPQVTEVITFMFERGFVPYDIYGATYRPLDGALAQVDIAFVPTDSKLRRHHHYATSQQRAALTRRLTRSA